MVSEATFRKLALAFDGVIEAPHFKSVAFLANGKKIFATYDPKRRRACLKLSPEEQDLFSLYDHTIVYAVPNVWGKLGWTFFDLKKVKKEVVRDALIAAHDGIFRRKPRKGTTAEG